MLGHVFRLRLFDPRLKELRAYALLLLRKMERFRHYLRAAREELGTV